jgi:hypothetical protein
MQIFVKTIFGKSIKLDVDRADSVESVKVQMEGVPKHR